MKVLNRPDDTSAAAAPSGRPIYDHPTMGQVVSAAQLGLGLLTGETGMVTSLAGAAMEDDYNRTLLGQAVDNFTGQVAGPPDRYGSYPEGRQSDNRGQDDTRLLDRAVTGDSEGAADTSAATSALFSDVALQDRRKPRSAVSTAMGLLS
jgi:hypothetical protein